ncbi:hypothetical protein AX16_008014 [Volvariella volvacea WC 439]|uniref:Superoxide dismutase [Cu-Zn] n=1 Tax=Volvariella volvacea TaxID=36659 RepID=A0A0K0QRG7_9AGAR|nr:copper-zinc superoxide dismutase [Volvariella volvacea]KAF8645187.1 hypothetical protein AX16_008014 [Volvariella volvacea WC 439]WMX75201.1 copper-zinc superoxide dismutase [Volvariella volvacea]
MRCATFVAALLASTVSALPYTPEATGATATSTIVATPPSNELPAPAPADLITRAVVTLSGDSSVTGTVNFTQENYGGPVTVSGLVQGLDPSSQRGFHVHAFGDLVGGCASAGPHFNPFNRTHGDRLSSTRHVGDLGNVFSDENGIATFTFDDYYISLNGPLSIIGRAVVIHAATDDLGHGEGDSLATGNAGARSACGVIGRTPA